MGPKSIIKCSWKRFVNSIYDWITSLYIDPRKGLLLLASWHFKRKLSRTAKNCLKTWHCIRKLSRTAKNSVKINLRHTLLLLLCEGADDVWRLGEDVLRNLSHNIRHRVKVADHLDWCLRHVRLWTFVGWDFFEFCIPNSLAQHLPSCQSSWSPRPVLFLISLSRFHFDNKLENLWEKKPSLYYDFITFLCTKKKQHKRREYCCRNVSCWKYGGQQNIKWE